MVFSVAYLDQDRADVTLISHTTSTHGSRHEVEIPKPYLNRSSSDAQNIVTVPVVKVFERLGKLTPQEFKLVEDTVKLWLGLQVKMRMNPR